MKTRLLIAITFLMSYSISAQTIFGKWTSVDDETGEKKSVIEIYEEDGKVFGKVVDILNPDRRDALCEKCEGDEKNKPVMGLVLIKNMEKSGKYYKKGTIFNPENGKTYDCRLYLDPETPNTLQVRGYIAFLYKSQYWVRAN